MIHAKHHDPASARDTLLKLKRSRRYTWEELSEMTGSSIRKLSDVGAGRGKATYADQVMYEAMYREECGK